MKTILLSLSLLLTVSLFSRLMGQGEVQSLSELNYTNERTFGMTALSNGLGIDYRYGKRVDGFTRRLWEVDFSSLRHLKEKKSAATQIANSRFVYGKLYQVFSLKLGFGWQKELFSKTDVGSLSIRRVITFGPSLALLKPIYYEVYYRELGTTLQERFDMDNPNHANNYIQGRAPFVKGLSEIVPSPGAFVRLGFTFEYGKRKGILNALEAGFMLEGYPLGLEIMATLPRTYAVPRLYLSYRLGRNIPIY